MKIDIDQLGEEERIDLNNRGDDKRVGLISTVPDTFQLKPGKVVRIITGWPL